MPDLTVASALRRSARSTPHAVALAGLAGGPVTYRQWNDLADAVAVEVHERVAPGGTVLVHADPFDDACFAIALAGIVRAGCFALPMSTRFSAREVRQAAIHHDVSLAFGDGQAAAVFAGTGIGFRAVPRPGDGDGRGGNGPRGQEVTADALTSGGVIIYTSGTTGLPRGVLCRHDELVREIEKSDSRIQHRPYVHQYPPDTTGGLFACLRAVIRYPVVHGPIFDPPMLLKLLGEHRPAAIALVPAGVSALMHDETPLPAGVIENVEVVTVTSAHATGEMIGFLRKTFPCSGVRNFYTTTEAGRAWTMREYPPLGTESPAPAASRGEAPGLLAGIDEFSLVGRPVPGTEVKITDPDHRRLPPRTIGSVWLRVTDGHSREYARYSDDEREVFRDGWVRTGDLGMLDEDGALYLAGRESDTLNVGGINVSAQQIEAALLSHDAVAEAAVLAVPHETLEQQIVAAVVMRPGAARSVGPPLREFVRERLGAAKTPARIVVLASLPRNGMGKVVKAELATVLGQGIIGAPAAEPERPDAESIGQAVREAWESSLGVRVRDPGKLDSTDFVALGGDSMTAVEIADALGGRLGWRVSPADVFRYPTPGLLTEALTARRGEGSG